jgi:HAL2 family 3'(2'),5'-bisphosphate nucleotidase
MTDQRSMSSGLDSASTSAALEAVATACHVARAVQHRLDQVIQITKDDRSPVTVGDFAVQAVIAACLMERLDPFGGLHIVGEESAADLESDDHAAIRHAVVRVVQQWRPGLGEDDVLSLIRRCQHDGTAQAYWTLDPIDGTKGFLRRQQYAIALAHIRDGSVEYGVLGCPNLSCDQSIPVDRPAASGSIYWAATDHGAWELPDGNLEAAPRRICATPADAAGPWRFCGSVEKAHSDRSAAVKIAELVGNQGEPVRVDSQCKYALVARGQADAYLRLPTSAEYVEKIWDHAAGSILATEAGAVVTDVTGAALDFSHGPTLAVNRGVICASPAIHGRILATLKISDNDPGAPETMP